MAYSSQRAESARKIERHLFVQSLVLGGGSVGFASQLVRAMREEYYEAGATIYRAGSASTHIYYIVRGKTRLAADGSDSWHFSDNAVIGILDAHLERPRTRTVTAVSDVEALVLSTDDYFDILEENFQDARTLLMKACRGIWDSATKVAREALQERIAAEGL